MKLGNERVFEFLVTYGLNVAVGIWLYLGSGDSHPFASFLLLVSFLVLAGVFSFVASSARMRPVTFMLMLYWCYALVMPALYQVRLNTFPWYPTSVDTSLVVPASLICLASSVIFAMGYFSSASLLKPTNGFVTSQMSEVTHKMASLVMLLLASAYSAYAISKLGLAPFVSTRAAASMAMTEMGVESTGVGILRTFPASMSIAVFLILAFQRHLGGDRSKATRMMLWLSWILLLLMNFPVSLPRFMMISISMIIVLTIFRSFMVHHKTIIYICAPIMMYFVFPFLGQINRRSDLSWNFSFYSPAETMLHGDFDGFQSIMNVYHLVATEGLAWGGRFLSALLFFVPRGIWEGKHTHTGSDAAESVGYSYLNISMPLPGELFADFGWVGLVIAIFCFGRLVNNLDLRVEGRSEGRYGAEAAMIGIVIAAYIPILFRGALLAVIAPTAVAVVMIIFWGLLRRVRFRS